ncbi:MAG: iron ABC transporter permease [Clostridia bacterium]|nr:iron ABC transporter permease [Clostridia bacterium]
MKQRFKRAALPFGVLALLLLSCLLALRLGSTYLDTPSFLGGLFRRAGFETQSVILYSIRLPRMLAGVFAGAGLALSGSLLQRVSDNALAAPSILGINAGAGFFVILALTLAPRAFALLPVAAFCGALLAALLILGIASRLGLDRTAVVLSGVALSALFSAGISFFSVLDADVLSSYTDFSVGGLRGVTMRELYIPIPIILMCYLLALLLARRLKLFCLGDTLAASLGVSVRRVRLTALMLAAASAAAAVSFAGLLGFVGLLVPHVTRRLVKHSTETELLLSPLCGAILLLLADLAGRLLFAPTEIPVGIFTALLGVPFFLSLLIRRKHDA